HRAEERRNVQVEVLAILVGGRALEAVGDGLLEPGLARLGKRGRLRGRGVGARGDVDPHGGVIGVGVLLLVEGAQVARPGAGVIDDPGFAALAAGGPNAFTNRHCNISCWLLDGTNILSDSGGGTIVPAV